MSKGSKSDELAAHISTIIKALLVAGRRGAPAEGRIPFNPLYFHMLRILGSEGNARPSQLADSLSVPRTTISTAVKALQNRNLVKTSADRTDGRALSVELTAEGKEVLDAILRQDQRNADAMLSALEEDERDTFIRLIGKVAGGVDDSRPA